MPENDFEKQVQQIFGEMKLKPSDAVWSRVHENIARDKKRRRVLLWLPILLLLLAGGGYWMVQGNKDFIQKEEAGASIAVIEKGNNEKKAIAGNELTIGGNNNKEDASSTKPLVMSPPAQGLDEVTTSEAPEGSNKNVLTGREENGLNRHKNKHNNTVKDPAGITNARQPHTNNTSFDDATGSEVIHADLPGAAIQPGKEDVISGMNDNNPEYMPVAGTYQQVDRRNRLNNMDAEKELKYFIPAVQLGKRKSWEWGVSAQAGVSAIGKGLSEIFKNGLFEKSNDRYNAISASPDMSFLGNQSSYLPAAPPPASPVNEGLAWNAGGFGKWHVKERLALAVGAEYSLYTTERKVGNILTQQNNVVLNSGNARFAGYYPSSNGVINYTNRYHFIQVPLGIQWQINKGIRLPLQLEAGVALGYLVNTTAVHYRSQTGVYYSDEGLFNKFQAGIYTGISAKLFQHSRRPLYVGPTVQYNFSDLTKPSSGSKQNLKYAGLKMQWVLWKN